MKDRKIGDIVAENFATAQIFKKYGLDFCCHGDRDLQSACEESGVNVDEVIEALNALRSTDKATIPFESWPLDLLLDYIQKIHHRGIRNEGPELLDLIKKVNKVHGERHPELQELETLFAESLDDLDSHLAKEENILFPYLYELYVASENNVRISPMHCGTISNPIAQMKHEHSSEGDRYMHIRDITNGFAVPEDACASYRLMMQQLEEFVDNLFEHIHLENNIVFPRFEALESAIVRR